jgi:hypothetical protein
MEFKFRRRWVDQWNMPIDADCQGPHSKKYDVNLPYYKPWLFSTNVMHLCEDVISGSVMGPSLESSEKGNEQETVLLRKDAYKQLKPKFDGIVSKAIELTLNEMGTEKLEQLK